MHHFPLSPHIYLLQLLLFCPVSPAMSLVTWNIFINTFFFVYQGLFPEGKALELKLTKGMNIVKDKKCHSRGPVLTSIVQTYTSQSLYMGFCHFLTSFLAII